MFSDNQVRQYLELALQEAEKALSEGNYPIGSIVVSDKGEIISIQRNQCTTNHDVTAHAEILNLIDVSKLNEQSMSLFTSLEPCFGCSFFVARAKVSRIYSALKDPHKGGIGDLKAQDQFSSFFSDIELINEPFEDLKEKSRSLMRDYFVKLGKLDKAAFYGYTDSSQNL